MPFNNLDSIFVSDGPLGSHLSGFSHRPEQLEMARQVDRCMRQRRHLAIEAGAGTGKTLAYLVPALLSGKRVIIATATKTLQDQLFHRDLPVLARALGRPADVAQLKGRSNYLCAQRLRRAQENPAQPDTAFRRDLQRVGEWALRTRTGDVSELAGVAEDSRVWPMVTSTSENCLGSRCPEIELCHVAAARRRAAQCDIAVVNHHLLLADMNLKDDGFGRLLPGADVVIVDEAHRFPETAQSLFDVTLSVRQLEELLKDIRSESSQAGVAAPDLSSRLTAVAEAVHQAGAALGSAADPVPMSAVPAGFLDALHAIAQDLEGLQRCLLDMAEVSPGLGRCSERATALAGKAAQLADWQAISDLCWVQKNAGAFAAHLTPLDATDQLQELMEGQGCTWIFTSATLAVAEDFSHFSRRIGLVPLETFRIDSPFDYQACARLFLPQGMPPPDSPDYTARIVETMSPLLKASAGRAFVLFTSHRALEQAHALMSADAHDYTLLVQGMAPRSRLLERFAAADKAVLLGAATFWEGVDIRGPALVVVVIDRLPFASPGDPLMQARLESVRRNGGDAFREYQLPQAILALRQGVGRLIRGHEDYGIVMICDPRLTARSYGRLFLANLPPMPIVRDIEAASAFLLAKETHAP